MNDYIGVRKEYVDRIKKELLGPGSEVCIPDVEHEIISSPPDSRYSIGILFPQKQCIDTDAADIESSESVTENEDVVIEEGSEGVNEKKQASNYGTDSESENDTLDEQINLAMQNLPSSMGYSFFAKGNCDNLTFELSFATYGNCKLNECAFPVPVELPDSYIVPLQLSSIIKYDSQYKCLRPLRKIEKSDINALRELDVIPEDERTWIINGLYRLHDQFMFGYARRPHKTDVCIDFNDKNYCDMDVNVDDIPVKLTALRRKISDDVYSVTVMLVNPQENSSAICSSKCMFQAKLRITDEMNNFVFADGTSYSDYAYEDSEELSNRLLYRNKKIYGYGLGTSTVWKINDSGHGWLENEFFPQNEVPSMDFDIDKEHSRVPQYALSMKQLSDLGDYDKNDILSAMRVFVSEYGAWIDNLSTQKIENDTMRKTANLHIENCRVSYNRMQTGISVLESDDLAWDSFRLANRAMYMQRIHLFIQSITSNEDRYDGDEILEKVLENLEYDDAEAALDELVKDLNSPIIFREPTWRPFQLAFLLMSIKSITLDAPDDVNPDRDIVDLIWFPTGGGKTEAYLGLTAFTIFHRRLSHKESSDGTTVIMRYTLRLLAAQQFTRAATLICACEYIRNDSVKGKRAKYPSYDLGNERITIGLWIGGNHTPNRNQEAKDCLKELMAATSRDLEYKKDNYNKFQVLKCPWCGTKLTKEISDNRIIGDWGYQMDSRQHFYLKCTNQDCCFCDHKLPIQIVDEELYSTPPTLLFGTVDKFAMMAWRKEVGAFFASYSTNRAPELIIQDELHLISGPLGTMVAMFEAAIDYLCLQKGVRPKIVASTATIRRAKEQCAALYNRDVAQFPSPGLNAEDSYFARESKINHQNGKYGRLYVGMMPSGKTKAMMQVRSIASLMQCIHKMPLDDAIKDKYWTLTTYFGSLRDLGKCRTLAEDDIKDAINRQAQRLGTRLESRSRIFYSPDELTSRATTTELNETLDKLEKTQYTKDNEKKASHLLLATNMISVGIDIARLNVMLLVGQPKLTSEYIQASSRVGRSFPGVAITMYDASKSRDRSHFEQFKQYHDSFYRYVEPTGATPFSKPARDRSLKALLVAIIRNSVQNLSSEKDAARFRVEEYSDVIEKIKSYIVDRSSEITKRINSDMLDDSAEIEEEIYNFFRDWEDMAERYHNDPELFSYGEKYMVTQPDSEHGRLLKSFGTSDYNGFDAMTSMRNVDTTVAATIRLWEET